MPYLEVTEIQSNQSESAGNNRVFIKVNGITYTSPPEADAVGRIRIAPGESIDLTDLRAYPYGGIYFESRANIRLYEGGATNDKDWFGEHVAEASDSGEAEQAVRFQQNDEDYQLTYIVLPDDASAHPMRGVTDEAVGALPEETNAALPQNQQSSSTPEDQED